jgi:DSF synthase
MNITTLWVDAALDLTDKNLRLMSYLVNAQERRWNAEEEATQQVAG